MAASDPAGHVTGTIEGVVVNASQGNSPVAQAEVILQVQLEGAFAPVEKTQADALGRFHFDNLPVGPEAFYLPGATRDGIFYPGRRIELSSTHRTAHLTVPVHDAVRHPNPLVIRQHEVVLRAEPGVLQVVEAMLIDNPGNTTYIGHGGAGRDDGVHFSLRDSVGLHSLDLREGILRAAIPCDRRPGSDDHSLDTRKTLVAVHVLNSQRGRCAASGSIGWMSPANIC